MNGGGDQLARGARSAVFGPARGISQAKWESIWEAEKEVVEQSGKDEPISKSQQKRIAIQRGENQ